MELFRDVQRVDPNAVAFAAKIEDEGTGTMSRWVGRAATAIGLLALGWATGCNGFFVYPGSVSGGGTTSALTALSGSPYAAGAANSSVDALAIDTTGNYLLATAATGSTSDLTLYSFDSATAGKLDLAASTATGATEAGPVAVAAGTYVYVANGAANTVTGYSISPNALTPVASPYTLPSSPTSIAVNHLNTLLYVGTATGIYGFAIGSGGGLTALAGGGVLGASPVQSMDISPDGNWLLVLDSLVSSVDEFQISPSGAAFGTLVPGGSTPYSISGATPRAIRIAPDGVLVFLALGTGGDMVYTFNSATNSGALTSPLTLPAPASPMSDNALAVSPNSATLYIARSNGTLPGTVAAYTIGAGGALTFAAQGTTGAQPYAIVVNAAGSDVYVANRNDGTISGFSTTVTKQ